MWCSVEILKLMLNRDSEKWNLIKICVRACDMNSTLGSVVPLAMFCFENPCLFWWHEQLCILWCDFWPWQVMTVDAQKLSTYWLTSNQKYVVVWIQNIFQKNHRSKLVSLKKSYKLCYLCSIEKSDIQCIWSSKSLNRVTTSLP